MITLSSEKTATTAAVVSCVAAALAVVFLIVAMARASRARADAARARAAMEDMEARDELIARHHARIIDLEEELDITADIRDVMREQIQNNHEGVVDLMRGMAALREDYPPRR